MERVKVAALQLNSGPDPRRNLERTLEWAKQAITAGAQIIALPESYAGIADPSQENEVLRWAAETAPEENPAIAPFIELSEKKASVFVLGGVPEADLSQGSLGKALPFNTCFVVAAGKIIAKYQKIHLFDPNFPKEELQSTPAQGESATTQAGNELCIVETPFGTLGLSICYDLRFPELYRALVDAGAEIVFVPSAFTVPTGQAHWLPLLQARAIENQVFVVAPAQVGVHGNATRNSRGIRQSYGHSVILNPWGEVLQLAQKNEECCLTAVLEPSELQAVREKLPVLCHRKVTGETSLQRTTLSDWTTKGAPHVH